MTEQDNIKIRQAIKNMVNSWQLLDSIQECMEKMDTKDLTMDNLKQALIEDRVRYYAEADPDEIRYLIEDYGFVNKEN